MQIRRLFTAAAAVVLFISLEMIWTWYGNAAVPAQGSYIKYVDFNIPESVLECALNEDIKRDGEVNWIDILSALACRNGADWSHCQPSDVQNMAQSIEDGKDVESSKYYDYYRQSYSAVLGGIVGDFAEQIQDKDGNISWSVKYGIKAFSPIAYGYDYSHSDDFGAQRTYGYKRRHLGHDMMGMTGTPIIAVESGIVEKLGWNQYGGWRIGIRSNDKKRYWYYAHLRKDRPYAADLKEGSSVKAGQVIGYLGRTGYSAKENVNNIESSHLHIGLELVFDESQFESDNEIWVDIYSLTKLLYKHRSQVVRDENSEYSRKFQYIEAGA